MLSVLLYACASGYRPVDNTNGRPVLWLKGRADSISLMLTSYKDRDTGNFAITFIIPKVAASDSMALSDVRLQLTETGEPPDRYVLQRINFYRHLPSGPKVMLATISGPQLTERQNFDLSEGGTYVLHYFFSRGPFRHYPARLSLRLDARLSGKRASDSFGESLDFRRYSQFSVVH